MYQCFVSFSNHKGVGTSIIQMKNKTKRSKWQTPQSDRGPQTLFFLTSHTRTCMCTHSEDNALFHTKENPLLGGTVLSHFVKKAAPTPGPDHSFGFTIAYLPGYLYTTFFTGFPALPTDWCVAVRRPWLYSPPDPLLSLPTSRPFLLSCSSSLKGWPLGTSLSFPSTITPSTPTLKQGRFCPALAHVLCPPLLLAEPQTSLS